MQTLVALLRAVNVGGTGKLPMADLRAMATAAGLLDVRTYIQSGNLLCRSDAPPAKVKAALEAPLEAYAGKRIEVILRTAQELHRILAHNPFPEPEPSKVGVLFLDAPPSPQLIAEAKGRTNEDLRPGEREIYIHFPTGMGVSKLRLSSSAGGTMRNLKTVRTLAAMAASPD